MIKKIVIKALDSLYNKSIAWNIPWIAALVLVILTKRITKGVRRYRVLCLQKAIFVDDVQALSNYGRDVVYLQMPRLHLGRIVKHFLPFPDLDDRNYYVDPRFTEGRTKVADFVRKMVPVLMRALKFDAVLSGNFVYWSQQEFFSICLERGIPVVVLYKEGMYPPAALPLYLKVAQYENKKLLLNKILFYNDHIKEQVRCSGVQGAKPELMSTVGIPRFDFYFRAPRNGSGQKQVVLFSFDPKGRTPFLADDPEGLEILGTRTEEFHKMVMAFGVAHRDFKVIIKSKPSTGCLDHATEIWRRHFSQHTLAPNIQILSSANVPALILESNVVLGYNSTALLEAIVAGKPVLSPYFGDVIRSTEWDFFQECPELVHYIRSYDELESILLQRTILAPPPAEKRKEFLERMIYRTDGNSSARVEKELVDAIRLRGIHPSVSPAPVSDVGVSNLVC